MSSSVINAFQSAAQKSRRKKLGHISSLQQQSLYLLKQTEEINSEYDCIIRQNTKIHKQLKLLEKIELLFQSREVQEAENQFTKIYQRRRRR